MIDHNQRTSKILHAILARNTSGHISIGKFTEMLGDRAFALAILIFSLPNSLPVPGIPGFSTITGIPILFIALQMILGRQSIWLPKKVAEKEFSEDMLHKVLSKAIPAVEKLEKFLKPRWRWTGHHLAERIIGLLIFGMALILALPIVGGNFLPGFCISLMALSILERDGVLAVIAIALTVGSFVFMYKLVAYAVGMIADWVSSFF